MTQRNAPQAIILAAGKGTRMGGDLPKVVHPAAGKPMIQWVVKACRDAGCARVVVVVGYRQELVREALAGFGDIAFVEQLEQKGTGHAAQMAEPLFRGQPAGDVFVLAGDGPLIRAATLTTLLATHRQARAKATLATAVVDDSTGYGRIVRDASGAFQAIVEQKDASPSQLAIREINPSYYCFDIAALFATLPLVRNDNKQGEIYLTDVPGLLKKQGQTVTVVEAVPPEDVLGVNNPEQLAVVDRILRQRAGAQRA